MKKADEVHYDRESGVVTARKENDRVRIVAEDCTRLDLIAGDDVSVRINEQMAQIESLSEESLMVREQNDDGQLEILTVRRPEHSVEDEDSVSTKR